MDLTFVEIPKIDNDLKFENLVKAIFSADIEYVNVNINGRPGQRQDGVDVFAKEEKTKQWIGVQCKVRSTNKSFSKSELLVEIEKAKGFNPKISKCYLYTTLSRDATTQEFHREISDELNAAGDFEFEILYWDDITSILKLPEFRIVYHRFYSKNISDNQALGHAIGKVLNLDVQFDNRPDTRFELIIGKIPDYKGVGYNADYFRGMYFLLNLNTKRFDYLVKYEETQSLSLVPSDLQNSIENRIDEYRVCKWLTEIDDIDNFIYDDCHDYTYSITSEERWAYSKDEEE